MKKWEVKHTLHSIYLSDRETFKGYYVVYASEFNKKINELFKGKFVSFQTELEVLETYTQNK